tara:strand:- start:2527 stop:2982 length:456 start_codon:yes stop_codon:yes gene_type:complete
MQFRKTLLVVGSFAAITLAASTAAIAHGPNGSSMSPNQGWNMGQGQIGPGMMQQPGYGMGQMGPGMMQQPGYGMGQMSPGMMQQLRQDLTAADVRHMLGHRLEWSGNPNVKLGAVEEKDDDTIIAEVIGEDGTVFQRFEINRHTGWMRHTQ